MSSNQNSTKHEQKLATMHKLYESFKEECPEKTREDFAEWLRSQLREKTPEVPQNISPELQRKIEEMYKTTPPHVDVFPPQPKEGAILIPTGGLARCLCSPECTKDLPIPAYKVIENGKSDRLAGVLGHNPCKIFWKKHN